MNNLRLELFGSSNQVDGGGSGKMKKLFPKRQQKQSPQIEHPDQLATSGHTLDRIVNAKEEVGNEMSTIG